MRFIAEVRWSVSVQLSYVIRIVVFDPFPWETVHLWRYAHRVALDAFAVTEGLPLISTLLPLSFSVPRPIRDWPFWPMMRTMSPVLKPWSLRGPVLRAGGVVWPCRDLGRRLYAGKSSLSGLPLASQLMDCRRCWGVKGVRARSRGAWSLSMVSRKAHPTGRDNNWSGGAVIMFRG